MVKNNIAMSRKERGMSLTKLSIETGLSMGYLCHLEKGSRENPSLKVMERISVALGKSVSEVFFQWVIKKPM